MMIETTRIAAISKSVRSIDLDRSRVVSGEAMTQFL
jgi:hypothetical protein